MFFWTWGKVMIGEMALLCELFHSKCNLPMPIAQTFHGVRHHSIPMGYP
ncbi:hypothetical protein D3OALGA1CA_2810 [Olavius algarvensis associated proteobacterium Delta 3]|nr:hypothetical protein D3OALGA1CA_2810 [Olavius algarvensis associated proteobacterium Delta 3]